jgi:colanic acid biosynthesis glycosyl transferase WcaI
VEEVLSSGKTALRILFISQLFDPENSIKGLEFARRLQAMGHEVEVVTTFPSYPGGKVYEGYRQRCKQVDKVSGIRVVRLPTLISHGTSAAKRMLSYASFGAVATLYSLFSSRRPDVIYAYYPPVIVGLTAMLVGKFRRVPFVYDVQDLWPEALVATGNVQPTSRIVRWIDRLCGLVYRKAARVVVLSDGYKQALVAKQVPAGKIERIFNWCDEGRMDADTMPRPDALEHDFFNILYAGNLGAAQALEHVVEAARLVQQQGKRRVRFVFLGAGVAEPMLKKQAQDLGLDNVQFLPRVTVDEVGAYLAAADALLVHLANDPVFDITIPQKTQAYMLAGRPILMAVGGEAGDIIRNAGAGMVVEPCQPKQLAQAAIALSVLPLEELQAMASRGKNYYMEKMSMDNGVRSVAALLSSVVENR